MTNTFRRMVRALAWVALGLLACACDAKASPIQIVAFGTSFTHGKGVWPSQAFPARLEALLRSEGLAVEVKNQGVDGDSSIGLIRRLDRAVPEGVQIVILEFAVGNERRAGIPMDQTVENVDAIVGRLVSRHIEVLLLIRGEDEDALRKRTKRFRQVIDTHNIAFLQIEQPASSLLSDRQHPTADAHASIAASMVPSVKRLIGRVNSRPR